MKAYTDILQSKMLAEILPLESADMCYANDGTSIKIDANPYSVRKLMWKDYVVEVIPCWSLAALIDVINTNYYTTIYHDGVAWNIDIIHHDNVKDKHSVYANTPINACVAMIEKLHEQKLL